MTKQSESPSVVSPSSTTTFSDDDDSCHGRLVIDEEEPAPGTPRDAKDEVVSPVAERMTCLPTGPSSPQTADEGENLQASSPYGTDLHLSDSARSSPVSWTSDSGRSSPGENAASPASDDTSPDLAKCERPHIFTHSHLELVQRIFADSPYPTREQYERMAVATGMDERSIKLWFQNRRAQLRKDTTSSSSTDDNKTSGSRDHVNRKSPLTLPEVNYQPMTQVSLPPDHPFCKLFTEGMSTPTTRQRKRSAEDSTPVARPRPARPSLKNITRRRGLKRPRQPTEDFQRPDLNPHRVSPPVYVPSYHPDPGARPLWRPSAMEDRISQESEAPLDLSVPLKRTRVDQVAKVHPRLSSAHVPTTTAAMPSMYMPAMMPYMGQPNPFLPFLPGTTFPVMPSAMPPLGFIPNPLLWGQGLSQTT